MKTKPYVTKSEKSSRFRMKIIAYFLIAILIYSVFVLTTGALTAYQINRYNADYNCVNMSKDCEAFFETLGIQTQLLTGWRYDRLSGDIEKHCWLRLKLPWGDAEFESTTLQFTQTSNNWIIYNTTEGWI